VLDNQTVQDAPLSVIAESWIMLDGEDFLLDDWPMHRAFYDGRYRRTLFKTSRQVAKSTTLANFSIIECSLIPHFSTMFVSPTKEQTVRFSNTRVGKTMRYSPIISKYFLSTDLTDRVFHKQFTNGSEMLFTYGSDDADRLRGPSTDRNLFDEVQDLLYDPIITVGNETMANSPYAFETYAGTPKTMENTIQYLWDLSTQTEWVMKCDGCNTSQFIDSEKSIGKNGPICLKCGKYINPFSGKWIDINPVNETKDEDEDSKLKGFHLSQLIMPQNVPLAMEGRGGDALRTAQRRWKRILTKYKESPPVVFRNEVLGVSDAIGTRMISKEELEELCSNRKLLQFPQTNTLVGITKCVAGVDWSGGGTTGVSRTVLWVWGWRQADQKLILMYYKVFPGQNPVHVVDEIASVCSGYRVELVVGDAGEGHMANNLLRERLSYHRVHQVQYGSQKKALQWNGQDRFMADRTTVIDNYFMFLKNKGVEFCTLEEMYEAITDMLNEYEEVTTLGKKVWRHSPQKPDDCLHAGLFGWIAFKITQNDLRFYQ
jgi:hypothetical protein